MGEEEEEMRMRSRSRSRSRRRRRRRRRDYGSSNRDDDDDDEYNQVEEEEEERVLEWEDGLPSAEDDLTPLSQHLIPPQLASAFSIKPEPLSTMLDLQRATHKTLSTLLLLKGSLPFPSTNTNTNTNNLIIKPSSTFFDLVDVNQSHEDPMVVVEGDEEDPDPPPGTPPTKDGSETRKIPRRRRRRGVLLLEEENNTNTNITEEVEVEVEVEEEADSNDDDHSSAARTLKRPRLVWTPQLHKRFVDVVAHLGIKNSVPKTIMQLMNVQGLTRENVASHLQKYRLYLKRMQEGLSTEGPSSSDPLFASTPVPHNLHDPPAGSTSTGKQHISLPQPPPPPPMPYGRPMLPVLGHGFGNPAAAAAAYQGFEFHSYGMFRDQQREYWSGNRFGPMMMSYPKASK